MAAVRAYTATLKPLVFAVGVEHTDKTEIERESNDYHIQTFFFAMVVAKVNGSNANA